MEVAMFGNSNDLESVKSQSDGGNFAQTLSNDLNIYMKENIAETTQTLTSSQSHFHKNFDQNVISRDKLLSA
jgi:hypothetical protein